MTMQNYADTIASQYATSPTILRLIENINEWIDPTANFDAFYDLIWNIDTAQGYGLDVWGRILGIGRVLQVATGSYLGFTDDVTESGDPFNQSPFYSGAPLTENYPLSDNGFRTLLMAKAAANICDGSIPAINAILMMLFGSEGEAYVTDGENMTMTYTFTFTLSPVDYSIVHSSGVLPTPAGVLASIVQP